MLITKPAIWFYCFVIFIAIGIVLDLAAIQAEEYSQFDSSVKALSNAKLFRTIHSLYVLLIVVMHLLLLILILVKKKK